MTPTTEFITRTKNLLSLEHEISLDLAEVLFWSAVLNIAAMSRNNDINDALAAASVRQLVVLSQILGISKEKMRAASVHAITLVATHSLGVVSGKHQ